jgi:hypothetical protein
MLCREIAMNGIEHPMLRTHAMGRKTMYRHTLNTALISSALVLMAAGSASAADDNSIGFNMVVSKGASTCLPHAGAKVQIISDGTAEDMSIVATGLPPNTGFDFFVIQVPNGPFGLSWYQGDLQSDAEGDAVQHFRGRFSIETFIVAPGVAPAPQIFNDPPFPDAAQNPATGPVQTYHLGLWFNSPADAQKAGCPNTVTPFNGEHNAGIQVLNTSNFPDGHGPLLKLSP